MTYLCSFVKGYLSVRWLVMRLHIEDATRCFTHAGRIYVHTAPWFWPRHYKAQFTGTTSTIGIFASTVYNFFAQIRRIERFQSSGQFSSSSSNSSTTSNGMVDFPNLDFENEDGEAAGWCTLQFFLRFRCKVGHSILVLHESPSPPLLPHPPISDGSQDLLLREASPALSSSGSESESFTSREEVHSAKIGIEARIEEINESALQPEPKRMKLNKKWYVPCISLSSLRPSQSFSHPNLSQLKLLRKNGVAALIFFQ